MVTEEKLYIAQEKGIHNFTRLHLEESDVGTCVLSGVFSRLFITYGVNLFKGNLS